jgi:hypothetical protein
LKLGEEVADIKVQKNFRRIRLNQFIALYPTLEAKLSGEPPEETRKSPRKFRRTPSSVREKSRGARTTI